MDALEVYLNRIDALVARLSSGQQKDLAKKIGVEVRKRNAQRIKANIEPDGGSMKPRQGKNLRALKNRTLRKGQSFYYMNRLVKLQWLRDEGDKIIGGQSNGQAQGYLKRFIMLESKAKRTMFKKIHQMRWLKTKTQAGSATVGFWTGGAARIATEQHQARPLLGFAPDDVVWIEDHIIAYLAEAL